MEPSQTFNACKEESLHEAMKQYVYLIAIFSVIAASFIVYTFSSFLDFEEFNIGLVVVFSIVILLASCIGSLIEGIIIHIGVYLFGGRKGIDQTIKAVIYSMYISFLLIVIFGFLEEIQYIDKMPFIGDILEIIVVIWPLALIIIGVRQLHEITTFRAATSVLFAQVLPLALVLLSIGFMGFMSEEYTNYASNENSIFSIEPTSGNGYILAGSTTLSETGVDAWLIKIDANGSEQWNKTFGGARRDIANSAIQTSDGGYVLAGQTESYGIEGDAWLIKIDANGSEQWNKTYGGNNPDWIGMAQPTSDGGFVLTGYTKSYGKGGDAWLIKTDAKGNKQWSKTFGGKNSDWVVSVKKTSDDGYILAGTTESFGAGKNDAWLVKTDANGNNQWERTFGGTEDDMISSLQKTSDGGFILTGDTVSYGGSYDPYNDCYWPKVWLIRTDSNGNLQWNRTLGEHAGNWGKSVQQTSDGGFIVAGVGSFYDAQLIKTDSNGSEQWNKTFGRDYYRETAYSVQQTQDGGYIFGGNSLHSFSSEGGAWLTKADANGNLLWSKMFGDNYLNKSLEFKNI